MKRVEIPKGFPVLLLLLLGSLAGCRSIRDAEFPGSVRAWNFSALEDQPYAGRGNLLTGSVRQSMEAAVGSGGRLEIHALVEGQHPNLAVSEGFTSGPTRYFLPLQTELQDSRDLAAEGSFDRFNFEFEMDEVQLSIGRQAISWGVNFFWPALDLFSSFAPQRIDRDYKAGVDAVRARINTGDFSEVEIVGAVLGSSFEESRSLAAISRFNLDRFDFGFMGGSIQGDWVAGAFFTGDLAGTGFKGEVSITHSDEEFDRAIGRHRFWKAGLGLDRQLSEDLRFSAELFYNGYGEEDAEDYLQLLGSERILQGEISALGRFEAGLAASWSFHPLWSLGASVLHNLTDSSSLFTPTLKWSTGDNSELLLGATLGFGQEADSPLSLGSEYGEQPDSLFLAFKYYY